MSVLFYVPNPKKLFRSRPVFSVGECLKLSGQELEQFTEDETAEDFDPQAFYATPLSAFECLLFGVYGRSGRGFELSFDEEEQHYVVRVLTPSTADDWQIGLAYLKDLAAELNQPITSEQGETFTADTIESFDFERDILFGLETHPVFSGESNDDLPITMYGINRPVAVNAEIIEEIRSAVDPIAEFSRFYREIQWLDAYSASQMFYQNDETDEIIGVYVLSHGATILPYRPMVEFANSSSVSDEDVARWLLVFAMKVGEHSEMLCEVPYAEAMKRLPADKYRFIDASHILVEALSEDEIRQLAAENA